jgi:hypothetical protein
MKTLLCERLGIDLPIIQAPTGGRSGPHLPPPSAMSRSRLGSTSLQHTGSPPRPRSPTRQ